MLARFKQAPHDDQNTHTIPATTNSKFLVSDTRINRTGQRQPKDKLKDVRSMSVKAIGVCAGVDVTVDGREAGSSRTLSIVGYLDEVIQRLPIDMMGRHAPDILKKYKPCRP
ncbi:hypothetical protein AG1IA_00768 [Rhizoctonia solani AG-1 IA]|uniref:Uncharacterized protein n=1 Tax=Thanatephorus cucumeris (strain AG1-IA) TaxID=983506 RepID=L8X4H4_THACA|nr:hypothetical protein AG1IA_00768 [Rhizoctonia solani AG-1 IA]